MFYISFLYPYGQLSEIKDLLLLHQISNNTKSLDEIKRWRWGGGLSTTFTRIIDEKFHLEDSCTLSDYKYRQFTRCQAWLTFSTTTL